MKLEKIYKSGYYLKHDCEDIKEFVVLIRNAHNPQLNYISNKIYKSTKNEEEKRMILGNIYYHSVVKKGIRLYDEYPNIEVVYVKAR